MIRLIKKFLGTDEDSLEKDINSLKKNVKASFNNLKEDIKKQKDWINHLYKSHNTLSHMHHSIKSDHANHKNTHNKDIDNINKWITHLHKNQGDYDKAFRSLETSVRSAFNTYNKYLIDIYQVVHELKGDIKEHKEETKSVSKQTIIENNNNHNNIQIEEKKHTENKKDFLLSDLSKKLTRSEKILIATLTNTDKKLSYKDLSVILNLSVSTIKNHVCSIKNKGFPLMEYNDDGNIKRHFISENMRKILLSKHI
jgi:biotin operon repressor